MQRAALAAALEQGINPGFAAGAASPNSQLNPADPGSDATASEPPTAVKVDPGDGGFIPGDPGSVPPMPRTKPPRIFYATRTHSQVSSRPMVPSTAAGPRTGTCPHSLAP